MNFNEISWALETSFPILGMMQLLPTLMGILIYFLRSPALTFGLGLITAVLELGLGGMLYLQFLHVDQGGSTFHLVEKFPLWGPFCYHVGADGLTILFTLLTAFLSLMVLLYGATVRRFAPLPRFLALVLLTEAALIAQIATIDLLWFSLTSTIQILLVGLLLSGWATTKKAESAAVVRYYQFMGLGLLLLFGATLMLGWVHATATEGTWLFDLPSLMNASPSAAEQSVIFYLLLYALAIRVPLFPLHGWLPDAAEHGTVASAMLLLLGVKSGIYGMLRYLFPLLPDAVWQWHTYVIAFAATGIFYAAFLAFMQQNLRRILAYAVISHTGVIVIGLFSLFPAGFQGSTMLAINFGLAISSLLLMVGSIYVRTHNLVLADLGGLYDRMQFIAIAFLVATLAIIGMPLTPGFDAVHLLLEASIERFGALVPITAALGNIAAASCLLWAFQRTFLAVPIQTSTHTVQREDTMEKTIALIMIAIQLAAGFYSGPWMKLAEGPAHALATYYQHRGANP